MKKDSNNALAASIQHARNSVDQGRLKLYDEIAHCSAAYFGLERDEHLDAALEGMVASVTSHRPELDRVPDKRRIVTVTGGSGAGKSRAVMEHIKNWAAMQPFIDQDGIEIHPLLILEAPSPCTPKLLAIEGLEELGISVNPRIQENKAWHDFRAALVSHRIHYVFIDEAQHAIDTATVTERQKIANALKNLVQMPRWPVRLILAGVPPLEEFLSSSKQIKNRRTPITFEPLSGKSANESFDEYADRVIKENFGLRRGKDLDGEHKFVGRLCHARGSEFGSTIELLRKACAIVILEGRKTVELADFVKAYAQIFGCKPHENVFDSNEWEEIDPESAALRDEDIRYRDATAEERQLAKLKFGDRP